MNKLLLFFLVFICLQTSAQKNELDHKFYDSCQSISETSFNHKGKFVTYTINTSTNADFVASVVVSGTPYHAGDNSRYQFTIRVNNDYGVTVRTFYADIIGASAPIWVTPEGFLKTGISSQYYSINGQFVDYKLSAEYDALPPGQKLRYFIEDFDGTLPPGLQLTQDGRITGQILDNLKLTYRASSSGGYDTESYDKFKFGVILLPSIIENILFPPGVI
jgi:hypothetical protein